MRDYFQKLETNPGEDLLWNVPETKMGAANVIGGNGQSFQTVVRTAEFLGGRYPLETVTVVLPESLRAKLPDLPNLQFLPATKTGSFSGAGLSETLARADYNLVIGDLSKNAITAQEVTKVLAASVKPVLVTRDAVDLVAEQGSESVEAVLLNEKVSFLASAKQVQRLLRAVYYPKVMTLSQPLMQVAEILHKFTLSYGCGLVTLHDGQILGAQAGEVRAVPLELSGYSPLTVWNGKLAAKLVALNLYNPGKLVEASVAAVFNAKD